MSLRYNLLEIEQKMKNILPNKANFYLSDHTPENFELYEDEKLATVKMKLKRLNDYRASRYCARALLEVMGIYQFPLLKSAEGMPIWPTGIVGSISHSGGLCIAVAASIDTYIQSIGIDIETAAPLSRGTLDVVCTKEEIARLETIGEPLFFGKIIFSIKESIFKFFYPLYQQWIGFKDATVYLDLIENEFSVKFKETIDYRIRSTAMHGKWFINHDYIITCCFDEK